MNDFTTDDLFDACTILFGPRINLSPKFLKHLQASSIKAAYRQKAFATHPDRALIVGDDDRQMQKRFQEATAAYKKLYTFVKDGALIQPQLTPPPKSRHRPHPKTAHSVRPVYNFNRHNDQSYFDGNLPQRKLLLSQFIYYSGYISWKIHINALIWQKRQRPPIGRIALKWGLLTSNQIQTILKMKQLGEKFGESALRMGLISRFELMTLIGQQKRIQKPIGRYFINTYALTSFQLQYMLRLQKRHNQLFKHPGHGRPV